jgi:hypothetical protein
MGFPAKTPEWTGCSFFLVVEFAMIESPPNGLGRMENKSSHRKQQEVFQNISTGALSIKNKKSFKINILKSRNRMAGKKKKINDTYCHITDCNMLQWRYIL